MGLCPQDNEGVQLLLKLDHQTFDEYIEDDEPYATSDGRPMGETDLHRNLMIDLIHALEHFYREYEDVYVSGNILMFYEEGNRRRHLSPDVLVTLGLAKRMRRNYQIWREGKPPDMVIEVTSASTRCEDMGEKKGLYALIGVKEICLFDPREEYLKPRLRLYRLQGEDYVPVVGNPLRLETLGLELRVEDNALRLYDPEKRELLPTRADTSALAAQAEAEKERAEAEKGRADKLEAELNKLRGETR